MSIRISEQEQTINANRNSPSSKRTYKAWGSYEKLDILLALAVFAPVSDTITDEDGNAIQLFRQKMDLREVKGGAWEAGIEYSNTPDKLDVQFLIGTQNQKTYTPLERIGMYDCVDGLGFFDVSTKDALPSGMPSWDAPIGLSGDKAEGVDIEISKVEFRLSTKKELASLPGTYWLTMANMTPSVNGDTFTFSFLGQTFVFPKGSVLFRGGQLQATSEKTVSGQWNFAYSKGLELDTSPWDSGTTYSIGDKVLYAGRVFVSTINSNLDNVPVVYAWDENTTYALGDRVYFTDDHVYVSLANSNLGNEPDSSPSDWDDEGANPWIFSGYPKSSLTIGESGPIVAEGWWLKWTFMEPTIANGIQQQRVRALVLDRVYDYADFGTLDL